MIIGLIVMYSIKFVYSYYILPRVLRDVSNIDTSTTLLGQKVATPIGVAPTGRHHVAHTDAEIPVTKGIIMIIITTNNFVINYI